MKKLIKEINKKKSKLEDNKIFNPNVRLYTKTDKFLLKTIYKFFHFMGESELHVEKLRQQLAKDPGFESYNCFKLIGGTDSINS